MQVSAQASSATCLSPISSISASPRRGQPPRPGSSPGSAPKEDQALARLRQAAADRLDKCDHPRAGTSTSASPRPQLSRRGWRTTASTRRCTSGVGGGGGNRRTTALRQHRPVLRSPEIVGARHARERFTESNRRRCELPAAPLPRNQSRLRCGSPRRALPEPDNRNQAPVTGADGKRTRPALAWCPLMVPDRTRRRCTTGAV